MIRKGECTYDFIKWHVLDKNGPFAQDTSKILDINSPDDILDWEAENKKLPSKEEEEKQESLQFIKMLMDKVDMDDMKIEVTPLPNEQKIPPKITLESCLKKKKKSSKKSK
jgi:hypothetical protein